MSKRTKQKTAGGNSKHPPKKTKKATPKNPKPVEKSAVSVNSMYDEMPDTIEDPAAVYRMAMLDMRRVAINNKLAFVAMEQEKKVMAATSERDRVLREVKAELRAAEKQFVEQKQAIEAQYGIALRSYSYNDETGVLTKQAVLDDESKEQPPAASEENEETLH